MRLKICELIPITSPLRLKSGPPELPGLTAASVWMNGTAAESPGSARDLALTMPEVTVLSRPYGVPIATTHSPTRVASGLPILTIGRFFASIFSTATSVVRSLPSTFALNSRRSVRRTVTSSAPSTTCALVSTIPSAPTMKPEPIPRDGISRPFGIEKPFGIGRLRNHGGSASLSSSSSFGHAAEAPRDDLVRILGHADLDDRGAVLRDEVGEIGQRRAGRGGRNGNDRRLSWPRSPA